MSFRLRIGLLGLACAGTAAAGCSKDSRLPESCEDVQRDFLDDHDDFPEDGEYTLYADGEKSRPWTAWCENMNRDAPKDYLTVHSNDNFSQVSNGSSVVKTTFERIRIDANRFEVDPWDFTFATTSGASALLNDGTFKVAIGGTTTGTPPTDVPYGVAFRVAGGVGGSVALDADSHIDLSGTEFVFAEDVTEAEFFCTKPATIGNDLSTVELSDDLIDVILTANNDSPTATAFSATECNDFSDNTRVPLQYDGHD